jgi:hypothetical protein
MTPVDTAESRTAAKPRKSATPGNLISAAVGAIVGGASTLVVNLGVSGLLVDNPLVGLAIFAMLAGFVVYVGDMVLRGGRSRARLVIPSLLIVAALVFGGAGLFVAPSKVEFVLRATPNMSPMPTIEVQGAKRATLPWDKDLTYKIGRGEPVNLDLGPLREKYREQLANCIVEMTQTTNAVQTLGGGLAPEQ